MDYVFQFSTLWREWPLLLGGLLLTLRLSLIAMVCGLALGTACAVGSAYGPRWLKAGLFGYVEAIRNTPFLVQLFLVFLGLPSLGLRLSPDAAAAFALTMNIGAYASEIIRAGIEAVPRGQIEAGLALGLRKTQIVRLVVLRQALIAVYPALCSQFILLMLGTSVVSVIAVEELTATANSIQSRTFRAFEVYFVVTAIYLALSLGFRQVFRIVYARWVRAG
ncbi:amino acid ABC transporter permease [Bosea sp. (in: a-proteobacteria)]|uniref:amino acid ABC transporter permease n=1 Tax=Bosea sp. (in: a-proteobacteria) TaxID=1871050 RepID=UPI002604648D|nr:amino acid ABC transporter permease [Bosea sp. (in: a-proteobacteria)]MCO5093373.1 amino acid ABC transporter permease [Bosea sp. (in: a-proteobacteria)]